MGVDDVGLVLSDARVDEGEPLRFFRDRAAVTYDGKDAFVRKGSNSLRRRKMSRERSVTERVCVPKAFCMSLLSITRRSLPSLKPQFGGAWGTHSLWHLYLIE